MRKAGSFLSVKQKAKDDIRREERDRSFVLWSKTTRFLFTTKQNCTANSSPLPKGSGNHLCMMCAKGFVRRSALLGLLGICTMSIRFLSTQFYDSMPITIVVLKVATFQPLFIATFRLLLSFWQENDVKVR